MKPKPAKTKDKRRPTERLNGSLVVLLFAWTLNAGASPADVPTAVEVCAQIPVA